MTMMVTDLNRRADWCRRQRFHQIRLIPVPAVNDLNCPARFR